MTTCQLAGTDGKAFPLLGRCLRAMKAADVPWADRKAFADEATGADYNALLLTCTRWLDVH